MWGSLASHLESLAAGLFEIPVLEADALEISNSSQTLAYNRTRGQPAL